MKKLYKSDTDKKWDGVCAGVAEYYAVDPTWVRIIFAFFIFISGIIPGLLVYIVLSWIIPSKKRGKR